MTFDVFGIEAVAQVCDQLVKQAAEGRAGMNESLTGIKKYRVVASGHRSIIAARRDAAAQILRF